MKGQDPYLSSWRWARARAKDYRTRYWVGALVLTGVAVILTFVLTGWPFSTKGHPVNGLYDALVAVAAAAIAVALIVYLIALFLAPYQQRNALRRALTAAEDRNAEPMDPGHAAWLQSIIQSLSNSLYQGKPCDYSDGKRADRVVREQFRSHFPELVERLDRWDALPAEIAAAGTVMDANVRQSAQDNWPELSHHELNKHCSALIRDRAPGAQPSYRRDFLVVRRGGS